MEQATLFIMKFMLWVSIPLIFGVECWEQSLHVSGNWQIFFQIIILAITLLWITFWDRKVTEVEMAIAYREWDSYKKSLMKE
jgi:hypothetical protein